MNDDLASVIKKLQKSHGASFGVSPDALKLIPNFTKIFGDNDDTLKALAGLKEENKSHYITYKSFSSGQSIVTMEDDDKTLYWLLEGGALVKSGKRILARLTPITCFGELAITSSHGRTATVETPPDMAAEVLQIDWRITGLHPLLKEKFHDLLLVTATDKLKNHFITSTEFFIEANHLLQEARQRIKTLTEANKNLHKENEELKKKIEDLSGTQKS